MKTFKAKQKAGFWVLLLAWLLIVIAPAIVFRRAFSVFLETRLYQSVQRVQPQLYTELQYFINDLDETIWLEKRLKEFDLQQPFMFRNQKASSTALMPEAGLTAGELHQKLEKHLGFQVISVFSHGCDTSTVDSFIRDVPFCNLKPPSTTMLRRFFAVNNDQAAYKPLLPSSYVAAFPEYMLANADKNQRTYSENFIQNYFGTIVPARITPGEILRTIASKAGKTGQIFLYYGLARYLNGSATGNAGGYLVAIRLQDIPESAIIRNATSTPFYPMFSRKTGYLRRVMPVPEDYSDQNLSTFSMHHDRYSLRTIAPQRQINRLAQQGTIFPGNLRLFAGQTPFIEVCCPLGELEHPLAKSRVMINLALSMLMLTGTMIFVRLYIYGFDLRMTIAAKIVAAVIFACLLPLMSLLLTTTAYEDYESNSDKENILRQLKMRNSLLQTLIKNNIGKYERHARNLAFSLSAMSGKSEDDHRQFLTEWCHDQPVAGILYKKLNDFRIEFWKDEFVRQYDFKNRRDSQWLILVSVEELFFTSPLAFSTPESASSLLSDMTKNDIICHFLLNSRGKMATIPRVSRDTRACFRLIRSANADKGMPEGFLLVDFDVYMLIQKMAQEIRQEVFDSRHEGSLKIDMAVGQIKNGRIELVDELTSESIDRDQVMRQMESCHKLKKEIQWSDKRVQTEVFSLAHFDQTLPLISVTQISRQISTGYTGFWLLPVIYALLVISLVIIITRAIFIAPAQQLIDGLEEIAGGNLQYKLALETGDEFELIGNECNSMTESLIEKARLEQYVSAEVLEEVRRTTEAELQPGGERIEATVLFASLHQLNESEISHERAQIEQLNLFLKMADTICTQNGGRFDKIIGHTIMMVFRSCNSDMPHQERACIAALKIKSAFDSSSLSENQLFAAGLSSGSMISGKIGSRNGKLDYTVIGDAVNMAARLKTHAISLKKNMILCSESMAGIESITYKIEPEDEIRIKGKAELCCIYRLTSV
ncbi:MAG: hypothetical protein CVV42_16395 [Candidatus Riflebacteria bacterium HGW-Riflebacteria-2]|jgi:class 3 adenylate cyclase|nr:MAG: hypothetical protein CVV42_16395 [Candidatus Riflebacteria bacterium HGW-Riflebacteria-2]